MEAIQGQVKDHLMGNALGDKDKGQHGHDDKPAADTQKPGQHTSYGAHAEIQ